MRYLLKLAPLPMLAVLCLACSGADEPESAPLLDGESQLALAADGEGAAGEGVVDKGRRGQDARRHGRRHRGGRGHHRPPPPPEPPGQACEVAGRTFPDGDAVPSGDSCNTCGCNDGSVICTLALCEPVVCALFLEEPDGVCSRFPLDPCIGQDPDCRGDDGSCEAAGELFPNGSPIPSGDSCNGCACNDGRVICTLALCEPVVCAEFLESSDGVCSRFPLDPCKSQDPDCVELAPPADPSVPVAPTEP